MFLKHNERATFQKEKNKKFVKTWKKVQYILSHGSLGNLSVVHQDRMKVCHIREEDPWTDVQCNQECREQRQEGTVRGHSLLFQSVAADYDNLVIRSRMMQEL